MGLNLDYYYGSEADLFTFYRIPKVLFTDEHFKGLPVEAKVLYSLLLDRMSLSIRNGWMDEERRVYIYFTLTDAMEQMCCGRNKSVRMFSDLEQIGLIERRKQGQGKPTIIYVKNFVLQSEPEAEAEPEPEPTPPVQCEPCSEPVGEEVLTSPNGTSRLPEMKLQDFPKANSNNTEINKTEFNDTDPFPSLSFTQEEKQCWNGRRRRIGMDEMERYRELIRENIDYDLLRDEHPSEVELLDGYVELMVEVCCSQRESIRIGGEEIAAPVVKSRFLKLNREHISYVLDCMKANTTLVRNIRAYTLTALYNAPVTMGQYYTSLVSHDLAQAQL